MSKSLEKAKDLAKKTNAAVMVVNDATDEAFVIMTIDEYERLTEQQPIYNKQHTANNLQQTANNLKQAIYQKQQVTNNAEKTARDEQSTIVESSVVSDKSSVSVGNLTEEELLAKINQEIKEWRSAQVGREQAFLLEMPPEMSLKDEKGEPKAMYKFNTQNTFEVNNLEDEERFFLDDLG